MGAVGAWGPWGVSTQKNKKQKKTKIQKSKKKKIQKLKFPKIKKGVFYFWEGARYLKKAKKGRRTSFFSKKNETTKNEQHVGLGCGSRASAACARQPFLAPRGSDGLRPRSALVVGL
jgi:hypothetical protein